MCLIKKPIKKTLAMSAYLNNLRDNNVRSDQEVQRAVGQYSQNMNNELIFTILTEDYIPPIILGEDLSYQVWIIDGLQRSTCFKLFRYGNYKITSSIRDANVKYRRKIVGEKGDITWQEAECDIKGKTYETLPEELQRRFDEYQVEMVIHEECTTERISELVCRYNNHRPMNASQKAFTFIGKYARTIRNIIDSKFFIECKGYTENEKIKGVMERIVCESVMSIFHLDNWKKGSEAINKYLAEHSSQAEFEHFNELITRLGKIVDDDISHIFTSKDSFIWFNVFDIFTTYKLSDSEFGNFIKWFNNGNDCAYNQINEKKNTKDKSVIVSKINFLEKMLREFLHIEEDIKTTELSVIDFVKENVDSEITIDDIEFCEEMLSELTLNVDNNSNLLDIQNHNSLIAIVLYSLKEDIDLDNWIVKFFENNKNYIMNQHENYLYLKEDLEKYIITNQS